MPAKTTARISCAACLCVSLGGLLGCEASGSGAATAAPREPGSAVGFEAAAASLTLPYPPGRWRLAHPDELDRVMLWGSHILVAHRDVTPGVVSFRLPEWKPSSSVPERNRREAFERAKWIAQRARAAPEDFARLAREYSDDIATRDLGGSFFGTTAYQLADWPELLDAFAALAFGEVSRVVETDYGFHVFLRRSPPPERRMSGSHIVIGYDQAPWLHRYLARRPIPPRSRAAALALADDLYEQLQAEPEAFEELVREHSDHQDALRAGDFGSWSTLEPTPFPREVEVLAALEVGQVARPIDSPFGVQIIRRTPERERQTFAMAVLQREFQPSLPDDDPKSRAAIRRWLGELAPQLRAEPRRFARLRGEHCCLGSSGWVEGRGGALEESLLSQLEPGEVAPQVLEIDNRALLVQRLPFAAPPPVEVRFELPAPDTTRVDYWVLKHGGAPLFAAVAERARARLGLGRETGERLRALSGEGDAIVHAGSEEEAERRWLELRRRLQELLGPADLARYDELLRGYIEQRLMRVEPHPGRPRLVDGLPVRRWPAI